MILTYNLNSEDRIKEILKSILDKNSSGLLDNFDEVELHNILKEIEQRIYYITESPAFELNDSNHSCLLFRFNTIEDVKNLFESNDEHFFVIYSIGKDQQFNSSIIRGIFIFDESIKRQKTIEKILNNEYEN